MPVSGDLNGKATFTILVTVLVLLAALIGRNAVSASRAADKAEEAATKVEVVEAREQVRYENIMRELDEIKDLLRKRE